jgi:hypothetical protein
MVIKGRPTAAGVVHAAAFAAAGRRARELRLCAGYPGKRRAGDLSVAAARVTVVLTLSTSPP